MPGRVTPEARARGLRKRALDKATNARIVLSTLPTKHTEPRSRADFTHQ